MFRILEPIGWFKCGPRFCCFFNYYCFFRFRFSSFKRILGRIYIGWCAQLVLWINIYGELLAMQHQRIKNSRKRKKKNASEKNRTQNGKIQHSKVCLCECVHFNSWWSVMFAFSLIQAVLVKIMIPTPTKCHNNLHFFFVLCLVWLDLHGGCWSKGLARHTNYSNGMNRESISSNCRLPKSKHISDWVGWDEHMADWRWCNVISMLCVTNTHTFVFY